MWPRRPFAGFVIRLLIIYGVFCIPWPGVRQGYAALYRGAGNVLFGSFGSEGVVRFLPAQAGQGRLDYEIQILKRGCPTSGISQHDSILTGYLPTAETIALVLATPIPWRRRWKALLYGVLLANGFVALRVYIILLCSFSIEKPYALYKPGQFLNKVLASVYEFIVVFPTYVFLVPVLFWILVTFRREDIRRFTASAEKKVAAVIGSAHDKPACRGMTMPSSSL